MSLVREHGKLRPQPPRLKNARRRERSVNGAANHDAAGHFTAGNDAAKAKRLKAIIRRQLGHDASGELVEQLYRETRDIFRACLRTVGSQAPQVQDTLARRARWGVLSAHYALRAAELGLETDAGQKCLDLALKLDARAERLDVTALDLAERLPDPKPVGQQYPWLVPASASQQAPDAPDDTEATPEAESAEEGLP